MSNPMSPWLSKAVRDLSWREVLARIAEFAINEKAVATLVDTLPLEDRTEAEREHEWVREALHLLVEDAALPIRRTADLQETIPTLRRGASASGSQLRDCALCIEQALRLHQHTSSRSEVCPSLSRVLVASTELAPLARCLRAALDEHGELYDGASDALRQARHQLARAREALRQEQTHLLRTHRDKLAGSYFAEREGRFVLPVRLDAPRIEGTVLGSSATGSTLYVEPKELIEKNNRVRLAEAHVQQEEAKILAQLSAQVGARLDELETAEQGCLLADRIAAAARWAHRHQAVPVYFAQEPVLKLIQMRHPLLLTNGADNEQVVANDLELSSAQALIISGPNAGGKTVALKCFGLAVWLSRSGLPVPCGPQSRIGWFSEVLTDIGDDQSISRSLSTFSAHVQNLAQCVRRAQRGTLLLLDEVAGGTDPDEGAALAVAVLHALVDAGASVATTTHYDRLKQLGASDNDAFRNASVGFDLDSMRPTFRITLGVPGASSALAVAYRFGLPESVVEHARACLPKEQLDQQRLIQQLEQEREHLESLRQTQEALLLETQRRRETVERERERLLKEDRLALERLSAELTREVLQARNDLRRAKALLASSSRGALREAEQLVSDAAAPITLHGALTQALTRPSAAQGGVPSETDIAVGRAVRLLNLNADAVVVETPSKGKVRVSVGGLKMSVPVEQVRLQQPKRKTPARTSSPRKLPSETSLEPHPIRTINNTCDLRGQRVDEGLSRMEQFLDQMLRVREPVAFILHGHGTGAMKSAVREHLAGSSVVRQYEPASREEGGDGLTIVWLA